MKKSSLLTAFVLATCVFASTSMAATKAEKRAAIDAGLAWLTTQQNVNGSIGVGGLDYLISQTGAALLAFLEEKNNWGANADAYQNVVDKGLNYLFSNAAVVSIFAQAAGNPDGDGNGVGVKLFPYGISGSDTYVTGLALPAIASSGTPEALVTVGPLASRTDGTGAGGAWTYRDVVQNVIDYFAFGQTDQLAWRGGWRYYANLGTSDQSTTQWPIFASLYAQKMGVTTPAFVKSELEFWVNYIQNPAGFAGYDGPNSPIGEMNETGALLIMQSYLGWNTSHIKVAGALAYINTHWMETAGGWEGNFGNPYAMWAIYKGLTLMIGQDDMTTITNLHTDSGDVDNPDHGWNWWEDYCEYLAETQQQDGHWNEYWPWNSHLTTAWYVSILAGSSPPPQPAEVYFDIKPGSCPNAFNPISKGVLPAAIAGTEEFDVKKIDPSTIMISLEGSSIMVPALRWSYEDVATPYTGEACGCHSLGADGYLDLSLKFSSVALNSAFGLDSYGHKSQLTFIITGTLKPEDGGRTISGKDTIRIVNNKQALGNDTDDGKVKVTGIKDNKITERVPRQVKHRIE